MAKYSGDLRSHQDLVDLFGSNAKVPADNEIIYAREDADYYCRSLLVVYQRDGRLYEMSASHCSCNSYSDYDNEWFSDLSVVNLGYLKNLNNKELNMVLAATHTELK